MQTWREPWNIIRILMGLTCHALPCGGSAVSCESAHPCACQPGSEGCMPIYFPRLIKNRGPGAQHATRPDCMHAQFTSTYRADWEPEAPSGKCMAGVPGVFWRCPAVLQGPSTHNPTWVAGKTLILKIWLISPLCMWKMGGSAPSGQARLSRPNWPQCAKSNAAQQSLSSRAEKLRVFSKIAVFFHF